MSYSKAVLMKFSKEQIIAEIHNILGPNQISQLITSLHNGNPTTSHSRTSSAQFAQSLFGNDLNQRMEELIIKLNMHSRRDSILNWSDHKKQEWLSKYDNQSLLNSPSHSFMSPSLDDIEEVSISMPHGQTRMDRFDTMCEVPFNKEIIFEGWMQRQTTTKQWKKRWFTLFQNNSLAYFKKTDDKTEEHGRYSLYELSKVKTKQIGNGYKIELMANAKVIAALKIEKKADFISWSQHLESRVNPKSIFEGFAEKKSGKGRWNSRYFKLVTFGFGSTHAEIRYYEESKMSKIKKFKGMIDIANVSKVELLAGKKAIDKYGKKRGKCLEIVTSKKVYVLSFQEMGECIKCKKALEECMEIAGGVSGFGGNLGILSEDDQKESSVNTQNTDSKNEIVSNEQDVTPEVPDEKEDEIIEMNEEEDDEDDFDLKLSDEAISGNPNIMLPPGWIELKDDEGQSYFHNEDTNVTQWGRPAY